MVPKHPRASSKAFLLKKFRVGATARNYRDQEVVFSQGDTARAIFYLHTGTVKLTTISRRRSATIAFLPRGSFFGEGCLAGRSRRRYTARSVGRSNIIRLQIGIANDKLRRDIAFAALFAEYLLSRIVQIEEDLVHRFFNCSERRLARVLLLIDQIVKESDAEYPLKVSQTTLAEMVGTTRGRISHFMKKFKNNGFVDYNGTLQIDSVLLTDFLANPLQE